MMLVGMLLSSIGAAVGLHSLVTRHDRPTRRTAARLSGAALPLTVGLSLAFSTPWPLIGYLTSLWVSGPIAMAVWLLRDRRERHQLRELAISQGMDERTARARYKRQRFGVLALSWIYVSLAAWWIVLAALASVTLLPENAAEREVQVPGMDGPMFWWLVGALVILGIGATHGIVNQLRADLDSGRSTATSPPRNRPL